MLVADTSPKLFDQKTFTLVGRQVIDMEMVVFRQFFADPRMA